MGKNEEVERIVFERISLLYEMAEKTEDDKLSRRYIRILRERMHKLIIKAIGD